LTIVKYDRSARQWQAINGRTWAWPAGPDGRREAELYALEHDCPEVAEQVKAVIANAKAVKHLTFDAEGITKRVIKAGFIIRDGKLLPPVPFNQYGGCLNEIARCQGSQPEPYIINYVDEQVICDCHDFMLGNAPLLPSGQRACKHILATLITETLQMEDEPIPDDEPPARQQPPQPRRPKAERDEIRRLAVYNELT